MLLVLRALTLLALLSACDIAPNPIGVVGGEGGVGGLGGQPPAMGGAGGEGGVGGRGGIAGPDAPCTSPNALPVMAAPPALLSQTGLYSDIAGDVVATDVRAFTPQFELWSDGATKRRWIYLPDCGIGTSDMDAWVFPIGTRVFKEFTVGPTRIETRVIHRTGPQPGDVWFATYVWQDDGLDAQLTVDGWPDAKGTSFDVPDGDACFACHTPSPSRVLGFDAIQLSHSGSETTLADLAAEGALSQPGDDAYVVPGDATVAPALGYLHANCGGCHRPEFKPFAFFSVRLSVTHAAVEQTDAYTETILGLIHGSHDPAVTHLVVPGDPAASSLPVRMGSRVAEEQMPPLGSEEIDTGGMVLINDWISSLPP